MCVVCGCSTPATVATEEQTGVEHPDPGRAHQHSHAHGHSHSHAHTHGDLHFGAGAARVSVPGLIQERTVKLEADILGENNRIAARNRHHFSAHGVRALNLLSSPGSGKTTLLCATIERLRTAHPQREIAVIEGDQQTSFDAQRIRATGVPAVQVNTGKGCHLDAPMVAQAFERLHSHDHDETRSLLFIENVGNLVCPALWDLGEEAKVVLLSVTEGEDKPEKYPDVFAAAGLMILTKIDLLPHLNFDVARCIASARRINPSIEVLQLSSTTGEGMQAWIDWLNADTPSQAPDATEAQLRARIAQLEKMQAELTRQGD